MDYAQFISQYVGTDAQFIPQYSDGVVAGDSVLVTDIDTGNVDSATSTVINASSSTPTFECYLRPGAHAFTGGWRHFSFAVENVEGKDPTFKIDLSTRNASHSASWYPVYTVDYVNWVQADSRTTPGDGFVHFSFPGTLPSGRVYIHSSPTGTYQNSVDYAAYLLSTYPTIAAPVSSADSSGVYAVSIPISDDIGRAVGSNNQYGIKLSFPGATTDGGRKRKLLMLAGIHAAGENHSWQAFKAGVNWALESASQEAVDFRANWDIYLYFLVNVNGVKGGASRADFSGSFDPNRQWAINGVSDDVTTLMSVIPLDTGGFVDAYFGYHGDVSVYNNFGFGCHPEDTTSETRTTEMQAFIDHGSIIFGESPALQGPNAPTDVKWIKDNLSAKVSTNPEIATRYITLPSWYVDLGEKWMRTLQAVDADGLFVAGGISADNCAQTDTSADGQISQTHELVLAASTQTDESGAGAIDIGSISLTAATCTQTDISSSVALTQNHALIVATSSQTDASQSGIISQAHALSAENNLQIDTSATGEITGAGDLTVANCAQSAESATGAITQEHSIAAAVSTQTDTSGTGIISVGSVINLAAANSAQTDVCQTAIITQTHLLIITPSVQDDVAAASAIVQQHILIGANSIQTDLSGTGSIDGSIVITPLNRIVAVKRARRIIAINKGGIYGN